MPTAMPSCLFLHLSVTHIVLLVTSCRVVTHVAGPDCATPAFMYRYASWLCVTHSPAEVAFRLPVCAHACLVRVGVQE